MFTRLGVRGRLFLSFFGISAFAVFAAATAMYSFLEVGNALERIIQFRVPSAIASLQLSRQAERIVAAAPALLTVTTAPEHERMSGMISAEVARLDGLLSDLERRGTDPTYVEDGRRGVQQLRANLDGLDALIAERLATSNRKTVLLRRLGETHRGTQRLLGPGLLLVEAGLSRLRGAMDDESLNAKERSEFITRLVDAVWPISPELPGHTAPHTRYCADGREMIPYLCTSRQKAPTAPLRAGTARSGLSAGKGTSNTRPPYQP